MAFSSAFVQTFQPAFDRGAAVTPWYRAGGAPVPIAVYQPKGAASLATSYVNLANPGTYDAALGVAPTFASATGWTFNGLTQYLDTTIIPASTAWSYLVMYTLADATSNARAPFGTRSASGYNQQIQIGPLTNDTFFGNGGILALGNSSLGTHSLGIAGNQAYRDGIVVGTIGSGNASSLSMYIGARHRDVPTDSFWNGIIIAMAIWNTTTGYATWMPAVSAAMAAL